MTPRLRPRRHRRHRDKSGGRQQHSAHPDRFQQHGTSFRTRNNSRRPLRLTRKSAVIGTKTGSRKQPIRTGEITAVSNGCNLPRQTRKVRSHQILIESLEQPYIWTLSIGNRQFYARV